MRNKMSKLLSVLLTLVLLLSLAGPLAPSARAEGPYKVSLDDSFHGSVTADKDMADEGETVRLTVTPSAGYIIESISVYAIKLHTTVPTTYSEGNYVFTMPASEVQASATFRPAAPTTTEIPSVGLQWNNKVPGFYDSMGYSDRVVGCADLTAKHVADVLEDAIRGGVVKDTEYMYRLYTNLFEGIRDSLCPDKAGARPYTMEELTQRLAPYRGTKDAEMKLKLERKFKRIYDKYNDLQRKLGEKPDGKDQTD